MLGDAVAVVDYDHRRRNQSNSGPDGMTNKCDALGFRAGAHVQDVIGIAREIGMTSSWIEVRDVSLRAPISLGSRPSWLLEALGQSTFLTGPVAAGAGDRGLGDCPQVPQVPLRILQV
jgi:hypothetical protein